MKKILLFILLLSSLSTFAQPALYSPGTMDKVYTAVYDHLKLLRLDDDFVVSYYMEETNLIHFLANSLYAKFDLNAYDTQLTRPDAPEPVFSEQFHRLFSRVNESVFDPVYELWFSCPEKDLMACTLYARGERSSSSGIITVYLFGFTPDGEIDYISSTTIHRHAYKKGSPRLPLRAE